MKSDNIIESGILMNSKMLSPLKNALSAASNLFKIPVSSYFLHNSNMSK